jgi:hypothetical protein
VPTATVIADSDVGLFIMNRGTEEIVRVPFYDHKSPGSRSRKHRHCDFIFKTVGERETSPLPASHVKLLISDRVRIGGGLALNCSLLRQSRDSSNPASESFSH